VAFYNSAPSGWRLHFSLVVSQEGKGSNLNPAELQRSSVVSCGRDEGVEEGPNQDTWENRPKFQPRKTRPTRTKNPKPPVGGA